MTFEEFEKFLKMVKYKPGFRFAIRYGHSLCIDTDVECAYRRNGGVFRLTFQRRLEPDFVKSWNEGYARKFIFDFIMEFERHEVGEWLLFGDERPFDPHEPGESGKLPPLRFPKSPELPFCRIE